MNTQMLADTIAGLDKELLDEVIVEHYKRTMEKRTLVNYKYIVAAATVVLLTSSAVVPIIFYNSRINNNTHAESINYSLTEINTTTPQTLDDRSQFISANNVYERNNNAAFAFIHVDHIYDGVYHDDYFRFIMADCTIIDDYWNHLSAGTTVTVLFRVYGKPISGEEQYANNTEAFTADSIRYNYIYDDEEPYKAFLTDYPDALMYIGSINRVSEIRVKNEYSGDIIRITKKDQNNDDKDKNEKETDGKFILSHCYLTTFDYIPVKDDKINLSALESFMRDYTCVGWSSPEEQSIMYFNTLLSNQMDIEQAKENIKKIKQN